MTLTAMGKLFAYNEWAWQRVFPSLAALSPAEYFAERPFFWGSLHGLTVHCYGAEWIWFSRCRGEHPTALPAPEDFADLMAVRERWDPLRAEWRAYVAERKATDLERPLAFRDTRGQEHALPLGDLLRHVMNHATEHRAQMTPVLYQLGQPTQPLDYHYFIYATQTAPES